MQSAVFEEDPFLKECLEHQKTMAEDKTFVQKTDEVAPPGWEGTVKAMKKHKDLKNPWALAWYMKGKGAKPHHQESTEEGKGEAGEPKPTINYAGKEMKFLKRVAADDWDKGDDKYNHPYVVLHAGTHHDVYEALEDEAKLAEEREILVNYLNKKDPAKLTEKEKDFIAKFKKVEKK